MSDSMTREELGLFLNLLLEGERAGAKLLSAWLDELPRLAPRQHRALRGAVGIGRERLPGSPHPMRADTKEFFALPDAFRAVFALRALEELSVDETAAALGIPSATVRTRFSRARSQLREALSREIDLAVDGAFAFAGERCDRIVASVLAKVSQLKKE